MFRALTKAAFASLGISIGRHKPVRDGNELLVWQAKRRGVGTVLDIGANQGQTGLALRKLGWRGDIASFEPLPDAHARLASKAAADRAWHVPPAMALGAAPGSAPIHVSANSVSSSLLPISQRTVDVIPATGVVTTITTPVNRLDDVIEASWPAPFAMKLDTQGFELAVLDGGMESLARTRVAQIEMSLVPLYAGAAEFCEVYGRMTASGFRCIALVDAFCDDEANEMLQVDGVFVRD
jgi:FkbM family methyltransferase